MAVTAPENDTTRARLPRGTKAVADAFLTALDDIPDARQVDVAKAAQSQIREALKARRDKAKIAARQAKLDEAPLRRAAAKSNGARKPAGRKPGRPKG